VGKERLLVQTKNINSGAHSDSADKFKIFFSIKEAELAS